MGWLFEGCKNLPLKGRAPLLERCSRNLVLGN